jgi:hypothetical protein
MPPPAVDYAVALPAPPPVRTWALKAVKEDGSSVLEVLNGGDARVTCENLVITKEGNSFRVTAHGEQVAITGPFLEARADRLIRVEHNGRVVLEGHVKLNYKKDGQSANVEAERVVVGLGDGSLEIKGAGGKKAPTVGSADVLFQFWTGFFH